MAVLRSIGNSKGVIISKKTIAKYELFNEIDIIEQEDGILIKKASTPQAGWGEAYKKAYEAGQYDNDIADIFEDDILPEY